jgi:hypothetical protein
MDGAILITIIGGSFGLAALIVRYLFYSKCNSVQCCGCKITRDTRIEEQDPEHSHNHEPNQV